MSKTTKFIFLIVMLCIPAVIFTFLKFFGDNRFDVEVFHQNGVSVEGCAQQFDPYHLPDSILDNSIAQNAILIVQGNSDAKTIKNTVSRLQELFGDLVKISVFSNQEGKDSFGRHINDMEQLKKCILFLNEPNQIVLSDATNRIRGYYTLELDEVDRLIVETKILLENDKREE